MCHACMLYLLRVPVAQAKLSFSQKQHMSDMTSSFSTYRRRRDPLLCRWLSPFHYYVDVLVVRNQWQLSMRPGLTKSISSAKLTLIAIVKPRTYMVRLSAIITLTTEEGAAPLL